MWSLDAAIGLGDLNSGLPFYVTLSLNVFRASVAVIDLILEKYPGTARIDKTEIGMSASKLASIRSMFASDQTVKVKSLPSLQTRLLGSGSEPLTVTEVDSRSHQDLTTKSVPRDLRDADPAPTGPPLILGQQSDQPIVLGQRSPKLTPTQFNVHKVLLDAGPAGLNTDALRRKSGHDDAVKTLRRLRARDKGLESIIQMAGSRGMGYRIVDPRARPSEPMPR